MRVLHLYAGNLFGGIERTLLTLWRARDAAPHVRPHFGLCFDAKLADELRRAGAPVEIFGNVRLGRPWTAWRARRRLRGILERERFDVAVAHSLWPHVVFASGVRRAGVPLVTWLHDIPRDGAWLERLAKRTPADLMLANSRYTASEAARAFPGARIELQYPPVELSEEAHDRSARDLLGTRPNAFVVLIASRLQPTKGHTILIGALSMLPPELDWECWIAGEAQRSNERYFLDQLQRRVRAARVEHRVRFLGHRDDVPRLLAAADVMCQPNVEPEGFGLTLVEALAAGTPVITTDLGAAREIIDETCGTLVAPNDARAVAAALADSAAKAGSCRSGAPRRRVEEMCGARLAIPRLSAALGRVARPRPPRE
jgi:glycosyltransferase involved in cell wall biosynthesis